MCLLHLSHRQFVFSAAESCRGHGLDLLRSLLAFRFLAHSGQDVADSLIDHALGTHHRQGIQIPSNPQSPKTNPQKNIVFFTPPTFGRACTTALQVPTACTSLG